jgi:NO-binding membrane sensor protein with MHYT domain
MGVTASQNLGALSILIATFASYAALDLGGRVTTARGHARRMWVVAAAMTMGGGIWSTHFVAMLAFAIAIPVSYDIRLTVLSLMVAILLVGGGFQVISRGNRSAPRLVVSGTLVGLGAAMHYSGMAAMRGHGALSHGRLSVALALVIAIGVSTAALWLAFRSTELGQKVLAAVVMGLAISSMHYTAMRGAILTAQRSIREFQGQSSLDPTTLAVVVANVMFLILAVAVIASLSDQRRAEKALRQTQADLAGATRLTSMRELTASLAEEMNQPITGAVTNAHACLRWLADQRPNIEEARACAVRIAEDGTRAAEVIRRIRLFCQRGPPQRQFVDVNEVIRDMIVLLHSEVTRYFISVRTELGADLPQVWGDVMKGE